MTSDPYDTIRASVRKALAEGTCADALIVDVQYWADGKTAYGAHDDMVSALNSLRTYALIKIVGKTVKLIVEEDAIMAEEGR